MADFKDPSDSEVVRLILEKKSIAARVEPVLIPSNRTGIFNLVRNDTLITLIETTLSQMQPQDCLAVLIDAEFEKPRKDRKDHKRIAEICAQYSERVALILAIQEIEAWLLADSGICAYLGEQAANHDHRPSPKEYLEGLLRHKKRRRWSGADRRMVMQQLVGDGDQHSPSMGKALRKLREHLRKSDDTA
ncbi:MAG: hypothetical protein U0528_03160 [Anaerolineae bacterium]